MSLNTENAILSNAIKVDSSYNVGIGGTPGPYKLDVFGTGRFSGSVGVGGAVSAWASGWYALQVGTAALQNVGSFSQLSNNIYYDGTNYKYITTSGAGRIGLNTDGEFFVGTAASGTAGTNATITTRLSINGSSGVATFTSSIIATSTAAYSGEALRLQTKNDSSSYYMNIYPTDAGANGITWTFRHANAAAIYDTMTFVQGKLGIGTTNPFNKVTIKTGTGNNLDFFDTGTSFGLGMQAVNDINTAYKSWDFYASKFSFLNGNLLVGTSTDAGFKLQVNGVVKATELRLGTSYTASYTTTTDWQTAFQVLIPTGVLTDGGTYLITIKWYYGGGSYAPYYAFASTIFNAVATNNGTSTGNEIDLLTSSHVNSAATLRVATLFGTSTISGLSVKCVNFATIAGGNMTVSATRIQ